MDEKESLRSALTESVQEALSELVEEVLLNQWVFISDIIIDGERVLLPVWDESMSGVDIEALVAPTHRLAKSITDASVIGTSSDHVKNLGELFNTDDLDDGDDIDYEL